MIIENSGKGAGLSVLTSPPQTALQRAFSDLAHPRALVSRLIKRRHTSKVRYGGHYAVTRSLIEGLEAAGYGYNYNASVEKLFPACIVLSGGEALRFAIEQKRRGRIRRLFAGPNIVTLPDENDKLIVAPEVDLCVVPSTWVADLYLKVCPDLKGRLLVWAAGVCVADWASNGSADTGSPAFKRKILVYLKGVRGKELFSQYAGALTTWFDELTVLEYGQYTAREYSRRLSECGLMVVFGGSESQGIALAEAWAANVPTWVHVKDTWEAPDRAIYAASAAPYLSPSTGAFFNDERSLQELAGSWFRQPGSGYSPQEWVLENMTDAVCAANLINSTVKYVGAGT